MKDGKVQAAILGCGNIGNLHAQAILANADVMDLYAVCDVIPEKADAYAEKYHSETVYYRMEDLLADPAVDMVSICTPSGAHADHVCACAAGKKAVLCEKPLDIRPEKIDRMIAAYEGTGIPAAAVFQYRTYPGIRQAKAMLEAGELGRILVANARYQQYRSPAYYASAGWRGTWQWDGGGSTMNQGIHILDILCYLAGGAESVQAQCRTQARAIEVEDVANALLTFGSGAVGTYQSTTLANPPVQILAEILCEKGRIAFDGEKTMLYTEEEPEGRELGAGQTASAGDGKDPLSVGIAGHVFLLRNLAAALRGEEDVFIPFTEGKRTVEVICGMYESSKNGGRRITFADGR